MKNKIILLLVSLGFTASVGFAATNEISAALQRGLFEEEANRNLDAAIQAYQMVVTQFDKDRQLAATAVFRLGECYRKLGKTNEAVIQYQRIVTEFSDQTTLIPISRQNLAALGAAVQARLYISLNDTAGKSDDEMKEIERLKTLIKSSPDLINSSVYGTPQLREAVSKGWLSVVQFLLLNGANVNSHSQPDGTTPLQRAVGGGNKSMVELLLANKADVNAKDAAGTTPLHLAALSGFKSVAEILLAHGADVNAKNDTWPTYSGPPSLAGAAPLHSAVAGYHLELAKLLLANKADVNLAAADGNTPLHQAVAKNGEEMVDLLLQFHANPNAKNRDGQTPLHLAASLGKTKMVERLLERGAEIDARDKNGYTPLFVAGTNVNILKILLDRRANMNATNNFGWTPLYDAIDRNAVEAIKLFLERGANPNVLLDGRRTPLDVAQGKLSYFSSYSVKAAQMPDWEKQRAVSQAIIDLLIKHGADENFHRASEIGVTQKQRGFKSAVFFKGTNDLNRFSLLELIGSFYSRTFNGGPTTGGLPFPDFSAIKINRLQGKTTNTLSVDLESILVSGDCSKDVWLEWGDLVEIPELDHEVGNNWSGFENIKWVETLEKCLSRNVEIKIKGETKAFPITIGFSPTPSLSRNSASPNRTTAFKLISLDCSLKPVVRNSGLLRTSSDTAHIKVTRIDPGSGNRTTMVFDLDKIDPRSDLWLRDGDVIEVPEK